MSKKYIWTVYRYKIMPENGPDVKGDHWLPSRPEAEVACQAELMKYPEGTLGKTDTRFLRMDRPQPTGIFLDKPMTPAEFAKMNGGWIRS